jgi:ubiquinone/menaquinone biosynthesis C-methylase UbiE
MTASGSDRPQITTVRLQNIVQSYGQSAALMAAIELGVFTAISNGAGSFQELADALDIVPTNAERLIVLLCAAGVIEVADGRLRNAEDAERFLVEGKPGYMGPWITFTKPQWNEWGRLTEHLRVKDLKDLGSIGEITTEDARRYHASTFSIGMGAGRRFVRHVDLSNRQKIMDIGGGSGAYCINAANAHAHIKGVVLDLAPVCEVATEYLESNGVADRVSASPCDFTKDPFPEDCDVAIMASNLPMYDRAIIGSVIAKAYQALLPGGEMHLMGEMTNNERTGPWGPAYWGLGQAISDSKGLAHSEADVIGYFRDAGFERVELVDFIPGALSRVVGHKV